MVMAVPAPSADKAAVGKKDGDGKSPIPLVDFVRASDERVLNAKIDASRLIDATSQDFTFEMTSYGWAKGVWLRVTTTGGAAGLNSAVLAEDGPFNVLANIKVSEPNGRDHLHWPKGYDGFLANKFGGYWPMFVMDPRSHPDFNAGGTGGNFVFWLWLPFEISERSGLGSQSNMDDSGQIKVAFTIQAASQIWSTQPDTKPTVRVRGYLSAWDPTVPGSSGMTNMTTPPAPGTTQYWSVQSGITVNAGEGDVRIRRKGNHFRSIIMTLRRAGTSRANGESDWPAETRWVVDEFTKLFLDNNLWLLRMYNRTGMGGAGVSADTARGKENGVRALFWNTDFDGSIGRELRKLWLPSSGTTSLRIEGNFGTAGTMTVMVNDVGIPAGSEMAVFAQ